MSNEFRGTGNVAAAPTLKTVSVMGETRKVAELRVFFDDYKSNGRGGYEQSGFWLDISVWGDALAEAASRIVTKGSRVHVTGHLAEARWTVKDTGEERCALHLNADSIFYGLTRVEHVQLRPAGAAAKSGAA